MRAKYVGNKADRFIHTIKSAEASAVIPLGAPVVLNLTSTVGVDDGLGVVLPSTAGIINYPLVEGVNATYQLAAGQMGEAIVYGYCPNTLLKLRTRATSTDTWASVAAVASGAALNPDFTNNVFQTAVNAASNAPAFLVDAIGSIASVASSAANTATVSSGLYRSFVRFL